MGNHNSNLTTIIFVYRNRIKHEWSTDNCSSKGFTIYSEMSAAQVLNSQLYFDTFAAFFARDFLKDELTQRLITSSLGTTHWGYCLQHKHLELKEDEIMMYTFTDFLISAKVVRKRDIVAPVYSCLCYSFNGSFHTVGVCLTEKDALTCLPEHCSSLDGIGICSPSFNRDLVLCTSEDGRDQVFLPIVHHQSKDDLMATMVFAKENGGLSYSYTYCSDGSNSKAKDWPSRKWSREVPKVSIVV